MWAAAAAAAAADLVLMLVEKFVFTFPMAEDGGRLCITGTLKHRFKVFDDVATAGVATLVKAIVVTKDDNVDVADIDVAISSVSALVFNVKFSSIAANL